MKCKEEYLTRGFNAIAGGRAILFLGAGFSKGAKNLGGTSFKSSSELREYLNSFLTTPLPSSCDIGVVADEYVEQKGGSALSDVLKKQYTCNKSTDVQKFIANLPWKRIYTTNYDDVFEKSCAQNLTSVTLMDQIRDFDLAKPYIVHLNGFIPTISGLSVLTDVKLSERSYDVDSVSSSAWLKLFKEDIANFDAIFYLGYTLSDLDIKRVVVARPNNQRKTFFYSGSLSGDANVATRLRIDRAGFNTCERTGDFVRKYSEFIKDYVPPEADKSYLTLSAIEKYSGDTVRKESDTDIFNFLLFGNYEGVQFQKEDSVAVPRSAAHQIANLVKANEDGEGSQFIVLHSSLGNGRSIIVRQLVEMIAQSGWQIFKVNAKSDVFGSEISDIYANNKKAVIYFDDFPIWLEELQSAYSCKPSNVVFLLSARTSRWDANRQNLKEILGEENQVICCDKLDSNECGKLSKLFDLRGLWGDADTGKLGAGPDYIRKKCNSEISSLLLDTLHSPQIIERIGSIVEDLQTTEFFEPFIAICVCVYSEVHISVDDLVEIFGLEKITSNQFQENPHIKQLVDFSTGAVRMRSSITAKYILKEYCENNMFFSVLEKLFFLFDDSYRKMGRFEFELGKLMTFHILEPVSESSGKIAGFLNYYAEIRDSEFAVRNPHFWLQYGIACRVGRKWRQAEQYLDDAERLARDLIRYEHKGYFELTQVLNNKARFYLETTRVSQVCPNRTVAWDHFFKAKEIVEDQIERKKKYKQLAYYPFNRAKEYEIFVNRWGDELDDWQYDLLREAVDYVLSELEILPPEEKEYLEGCRKIMLRIKERIGEI